jgi:hypothetical protein
MSAQQMKSQHQVATDIPMVQADTVTKQISKKKSPAHIVRGIFLFLKL